IVLCSHRRCERCHDTFINKTNSCNCNPPNTLAGGICVNGAGHILSRVVSTIRFGQLGVLLRSEWLSVHLQASAAACLQDSNQTACQALGNMCVMNMHSTSPQSADACGLFRYIFTNTAALGVVHSISFWRTNIPWLYYDDQPGLAARVLAAFPFPENFSFKLNDQSRNRNIKLLAAVYDARGRFGGWRSLTRGLLQLCPDTDKRLDAAFLFGTTYEQNCELSIAKLLRDHPEPMFFDVYITYGGIDGQQNIWPVPVLNRNLQHNDQFVNLAEQGRRDDSWFQHHTQGNSAYCSVASPAAVCMVLMRHMDATRKNINNWILTRRILLVDSLSGRENTLSSVPHVIRIASKITIRRTERSATQLVHSIAASQSGILKQHIWFLKKRIITRDFYVSPFTALDHQGFSNQTPASLAHKGY
ncbi:unnamed protein product, partial [Ranitomeya imitator]